MSSPCSALRESSFLSTWTEPEMAARGLRISWARLAETRPASDRRSRTRSSFSAARRASRVWRRLPASWLIRAAMTKKTPQAMKMVTSIDPRVVRTACSGRKLGMKPK